MTSLLDLLGQAGQVVFAHGFRELEIVVEAVLDRRTYGHLGAGIEPGSRLGQNMGGRVPHDVEALRRRRRD